MPADGEKSIGLIKQRFPEAVLETGSYREQHWVTLDRDRLQEICLWLRDDPETAYDFLVDVTAAHWPENSEPLELIYHLFSNRHKDRLRLKVRAGADGKVPTLVPVWEAADWNEREAYDMFGVVFDGHPDLRRILMPEDYDLFPLRKEFPLFSG